MRIVALVPARGGSKRLLGKNVRELHGKPLIVWSVEVAQGMREVCDVLVSTDDAAIADVARTAGALVPWLRPAELATDTATTLDVAVHTLDWYEREHGPVDGLMLLQPTSPFRTRETVQRAIALFAEHGPRSVVSLSPAPVHPMWCFAAEETTMRPFMGRAALDTRSQDLPPAYALNGSVYLVTPDQLRTRRTFVADDAVPLIVHAEHEALDIDTDADWRVALSLPRPAP